MSNKDLQGEIDAVAELNKLYQELGKLREQQGTIQSSQATISQQVTESTKQNTQATTEQKDATKAVTDAMREQTDGAEGLAQALGRQSKASSNLKTSQEDNVASIAKMVEQFGLLNIAMAAGQEAMNATKLVFTTGLDLMTSGFGMLQSGIGLAMAPLNGLMKAAADYRNKHAQAAWAANQELTRSFGDLNGESAKFVKSMQTDIMGASDELAKAGNSMYKAIGHSYEILQHVTKMAGEFGDQFHRLKGQIKGAADEMFIMGRGMNISGESMKMMGINAEAAGGSLEDSLKEGMVASAHLANTFGLDVKDIGKNMDKMQKDMATFGHMAPKELAAVATYATKLGMSIEALKGTMDAFDTFESAAANAGKLSEAFGMNIDVMKMMNAENPAERMDMLRKSFEETGKSVSDLSRHELKLLSESMGGIPIEELKTGLSMSTDEMGFGDMADAAEAAAEKMTPEKAMEQVAKSIDELKNAIVDLQGGPLADFIKGFTTGLERSKEFKAILGDIADWLQLFQDAGRRIGELFGKTFLKEGTKFHTLINNIFNLEKAKAFLDTVEKAFGALFGGLSEGKDPGKLAASFFDDMMKAFKDWIGLNGGDGGIGDLLKEMLANAIKFVGGLAPKIIQEASKYIVQFAEGLKKFLESDDKINSTVGGGVAGAFVQAFDSIKDSLVTQLLPAMMSLFSVLFEKFGPIIIPILAGTYAIIFVKSMVAGMLQAAASTLLQAGALTLSKKLAKIMDKSGSKQMKVNDKQNKSLKKASEDLGGKKGMIANLAKISPKDIAKAGGNLLIMAGAFALGMLMFAVAMVGVALILGTVSWESLGKGILGLGAAVLTLLPMIGAVKLLQGMVKGPGDYFKMAGHLIGAAFLFAVGGAALAVALLALNGVVSLLDPMQTLKTMAILTPAFIAAAVTVGAAYGLLKIPMKEKDYGKAIVALLGAALLFAVGGVALAIALQPVNAAFAELDSAQTLKSLGLLTLTSLAVMPTILAAAGLGFLMSKINPLYVIAGFAMVVGILAASVFAFPMALKQLTIGMKEATEAGSPMKALAMMAALIAVVIPVILISAALGAAAMLAMTLIPGGMGVVAVIAALGLGFALLVGAVHGLAHIAPTLGGAIKAIVGGINVQNPKAVLTVIKIVGELMGVIATLGKLAVLMPEMKAAKNVVKPGGDGEQATNNMGGFIENCIASLKKLVTNLVDASKSMSDPKVQKGAEVVCKIIGVVANLVGVLIKPMMEIVKNKGFFTSNKELATDMTTVATGMAGVFDSLGTAMEKITVGITNVFKELEPEEVDKLAKTAPVMSAIFSGIASVASAMKDLGQVTKHKDELGKLNPTEINDSFALLEAVMGGDAFISVIKAFGKFTTATGAIDLEVAKGAHRTFATIKNLFGGFVDVANKMVNAKNASIGPVQVAMMDKVATNLKTWRNGGMGPASIVKMANEEAKELIEALQVMDADLGEINVHPLAEGILGASGERTFSIKAEAVQLNVNFSIKMDAEELGSSIVKGTNNEMFVLTGKAQKEFAGLEGMFANLKG